VIEKFDLEESDESWVLAELRKKGRKRGRAAGSYFRIARMYPRPPAATPTRANARKYAIGSE